MDEDPALELRRDLRLVELLDELGYEEAWFGEHHSGGWEIIASPELMIAAAAERTKRIRLGTGVISLPYHHPLNVADRIVQLDHMTLGRAMFGVGPGLLTADAIMRGIDPMVQRERMADAIDVILRLFRGETVTRTTDWYVIKDARLHLLPYTKPHPEMAVASTLTPSGGRIAGMYGFGMLCLAAMQPEGNSLLAEDWRLAKALAAENHRTLSLSDVRLVGFMHLADTRERARQNLAFGFKKWLTYHAVVNEAQAKNLIHASDPLAVLIDEGRAVIGTPEDAIEQIERLRQVQGDFGCFLQMGHNWADWEETKRSYELYARYVVPHLRGVNAARTASLDHFAANRDEFTSPRVSAANATIAKLRAAESQHPS